tara:strand:- start:50 stop:436 length:387 start_codon:yes stop_codon:yes gene_type:complete
MKENWKEVTGFSDYQVSDLGRVKNKKGVIKKGTSERYSRAEMYIEGKRYRRAIHIMVAEAFLEHTSGGELVVDHIDENPKNNNLSNLQIITGEDNKKKSIEHRYNKVFTGDYKNDRPSDEVRVYAYKK